MMQYLLTEEEFNDLHEGHANEIFVIKERLQKACTLAAEHTPVKLPWAEDDDPVPWVVLELTTILRTVTSVRSERYALMRARGTRND